MGTAFIGTEDERRTAILQLEKAKLPFTLTYAKGSRRSLAQNRLMQKWYKEIAKQMYEEPEYARAYCKLHFGIPILRADNEAFRDAYDNVLKSKTYEDKMAMMMWPFELPVTSLMTVDQLRDYLQTMQRFFTEKGFHLTEPDSELK